MTNQNAEALARVKATLQPGDAEKWAAYEAMNSDEQLEWRKREGHGEFCRLQRLSFRRFI